MKNRLSRASLWLVIATYAFATSAFAADLAQRLDALAEAAPTGGFFGIHVVEVTSGKTVYARNEDRLLLPASNLKILTAAVALERLGQDYRFTTRVIREAAGDLVLIGSGDPSLSGRVFPYQKDARPRPALAAIEDLADQIAAHGVRRIDGDIVGDDRWFPWDPYPASWTEDDTIRDYGAAVSALTFNDNVVAVAITSGTQAGDPAVLSLAPVLEYLTFDNRVATGPRASQPRVRAQRVPGSRQWLLTGSIPAGRARVVEILPVDDPALFAASALYSALTARGIVIRGRPVARHRAFGETYVAAEGEELASRKSPPLHELLQMMAKLSQNLHAELILREVGRSANGPGAHDGTHDGTTEAGLAELTSYLSEIGAQAGEWRLQDGSGLSRNALVTPRLLTRALTGMAKSMDKEIWISLLPAGGEDGTLSHRLCCVADGFGIRAKTGSLSRALALSGYAESMANGQLAFSILVNDFSASAGAVRQWIDKIAIALLE
jgi:serine-type D-Ala-D-Ala carboxypeptidase/endopeptidase (penicillin-binding protein 4)